MITIKSLFIKFTYSKEFHYEEITSTKNKLFVYIGLVRSKTNRKKINYINLLILGKFTIYFGKIHNGENRSRKKVFTKTPH